MACFYMRTGALVQLSNGNRTAARNNPAQEFNNGVVLSTEPLRNNQLFEVRIDKKINSWSGSIEIGVTTSDPRDLVFPPSATGFREGTYIMSGASVLKDGHTALEEYGMDLDQLGEGDRIGVIRTERGALHFYVNGVDQGLAVASVPEKVWAVVDMYGKCAQVTIVDDINRETILHNEFTNEMIQEASFAACSDRLIFHDKTGTLIRLTNGRRTAERRRPMDEFNNGVVMTNRAIRDDEMFEIRIDRLVDKWSGSIEVGITAHDPATLDFPATMTNMRTGQTGHGGGTIMMSGCGILTNGKGTQREYGNFNLDELQEGDHIGLMRKGSGALHYYINGEDQGIAALNAPNPAWGVVDLYGMAVKVTIVDGSEAGSRSDVMRRSNSSSLAARSSDALWNLARDPLSPEQELTDAPWAGRLLFHAHCGAHAAVTNNGLTAHRPNCMDDFNAGVVLTNRPLKPGEMFEVRLDKLIDKWAGSIEIGVTTHSPASFDFPSTMTNVRSGTWMMTGNGVMHNGTTVLDDYGQNLDQLKVGDRVGVLLKDDGSLHFYVNGVDQGPGASEVPPLVYGVVDLYGQAAMATIIPKEEDLLLRTSDALEMPSSVNAGAVGGAVGGLNSVAALVLPVPPSSTAPRDVLRFHPRHGRNAVISADGRTASRTKARGEFNDAIVITSRPLLDNELFEVSLDVMVDRWSGSIEAGVTLITPDDLDMPSTMTDIDYDTWMLSGSAVMKDGSTVRNGYKVDLDALPASTRVGMLRASDSTLHFYVDGVDMGVACSGVPTGVYAVIDLYGQCAQVSITDTSRVLESTLTASSMMADIDPSLTSPICTAVPATHRFSMCAGKHVHIRDLSCDSATRVQGFNHGLVFSMEPLSPGELFEIRIERVNRQWSGSLHIGLTTLAVNDGMAHSLLPASALDLRSSNSWILAGSRVSNCGRIVRDNYGPSLNRLNTGDRVGVMYTNDGRMHVFVNGVDLGSAVSGIPEGVFAVVDIFGVVECISITSALHSPHETHLNASAPPSIHSLDSFTGSESDETEEESDKHGHCLHTAHGRHVTLLHDNRTAARTVSYNNAIVLSARPLVAGETFQIRLDKVADEWSSGVGVGVVACSPERLVLAPRAVSLRQPNWVVHGRNVFHNGNKIRDNYGVDLDGLCEGSTVGVSVTDSGAMHLFVNGTDQGVAIAGLSPVSTLHAVFDLYGKCEQVCVVSTDTTTPSGAPANGRTASSANTNAVADSHKEKADNELHVKEKLVLTETGLNDRLSPCEYEALCTRFMRSLALPEGFFNSLHNRCFCNTCQNTRGDAPYYRKGEPPKDVAVPVGWYKFALKMGTKTELQKLDKWHIAYHGAHVSSVRRALDTQDLIPAGEESVRTLQPQLFARDEKNKPEGERGDKQFYFSPTIKYAGSTKFSPSLEWRDPVSRKSWQAQVAWQVCVKPGSYKLAHEESAELALQGERIDSRFANSEIAWHTKEKGAVSMCALLVRVV